MLDQGKHAVVDHVLIVGVDTLAHDCRATMVLDLLGALDLGQYQVGIARDAHVAPGLAIVGVLGNHQLLGRLDQLVIQAQRLLGADIHRIAVTQAQLDQPDDAVVDDADKLGPDALAHLGLAVEFQRADALGLDKDLVGHRAGTQDAPRRAIVLHLVDEQLTALGDHLVILFACLVVHDANCLESNGLNLQIYHFFHDTP